MPFWSSTNGLEFSLKNSMTTSCINGRILSTRAFYSSYFNGIDITIVSICVILSCGTQPQNNSSAIIIYLFIMVILIIQ